MTCKYDTADDITAVVEACLLVLLQNLAHLSHENGKMSSHLTFCYYDGNDRLRCGVFLRSVFQIDVVASATIRFCSIFKSGLSKKE